MSNTRRNFLKSISLLAAGTVVYPSSALSFGKEKLKVVLVGTGVRGIGFWGKRLVDNYSDVLEFVGLSDVNIGRLAYAKSYMGVDCKLFEDFDKMIVDTKPDLVIVTTKDSVHHEYIIKGLNYGCDVLTEKPLTIDEDKSQAILDAERISNKKLIVGFNYRWSPYTTKIKSLLQEGSIGEITSVDFHWYLNTYHGASYFRRWHGLRQEGGTLWVHKATHHFDLLNWWLDSDPTEVFAYGDLEVYGSNGKIRGGNCRTCSFKNECEFHWDITKKDHYMKLYADNEKYDGYIRDNCVFRHEINIYDKMSAQIKYANNTVVNYSLTTYSPFEGYRIAFNGTKGRIEAWLDIPYLKDIALDQNQLHEAEMNQEDEIFEKNPVIVHKLWEDHETIVVKSEKSGHGGGDKRLHEKIFTNPDAADPYGRSAGIRDGIMSVLIGVAARKSIEENQPIKIAGLTDLKPRAERLTSGSKD